MTSVYAQGEAVPAELCGDLKDSSPLADDSAALQSRFRDDGYVLIRGQLDAAEVEAARHEVFARLHEVDEVAEPIEAGIFTGRSQRHERLADLGAFWRSVSQGPALRAVSHGTRARTLLSRLLGEPARPHDYIFLRPGVVGRSTRLHYDLPFFARGSDRIVTVWTALGEIPLDRGPLMVLENSHHFTDLLEPIRQIDYESNESPQVQWSQSPIELAQQRGTRLLTTEFAPGDLVIFSMTLMHGALDNRSPHNAIRLSCDVRWQPAADPLDARYAGDDPPGTTGAGYGELNGAKPLTEDWHTR